MRAVALKAADLARASGLSATAVSRYRSGSREPNAAELLALAGALGVTMEWLLTGANRSGPNSESPEKSAVPQSSSAPAVVGEDPFLARDQGHAEMQRLRAENKRLREILGGVRALVAEPTIPPPVRASVSYRPAKPRG